jgi:hypothetical protein
MRFFSTAGRAGWWLMAALIAGCGGSVDSNPTRAELRLVNATSGYPALDLLIDDDRRFSSVTFGQTEEYAEIDPDETDSVLATPGSSTPLVSFTPALERQESYTVLAYGVEGSPRTLLLDEDGSEDDDKAKLRFVNVATDAGALDVYVTAPNDALSTAVPLQAGAEIGEVSTYSTFSPGTWRVRVTKAGDKTDLRFDSGDVVLKKEQVATLVVAPAGGGALVSVLLLNEQGSIVAISGALARVRVAVPNADEVSASVAGQALMTAAAGPAVESYQLVPAGTQAVSVTVDGATVAVPDVTLAAGSDQTLMVYRNAGQPRVVWLPDDNRPPTAAGTAKLRLVHGLDGLSGPLSMKADLKPVASNVTLGTASTYAAVQQATDVAITVNAAGTETPVLDLLDRDLLAGAVYSVFVVEGTVPNRGFLVQDR